MIAGDKYLLARDSYTITSAQHSSLPIYLCLAFVSIEHDHLTDCKRTGTVEAGIADDVRCCIIG